ncbi:MAG: division/cell wall cluster transcriptional repressor MraZ [Bacteroidetes bacterium]|nr:division/cell wall cluster transcriptional repressor MraZ [Bacteroidota bacterium]
MFQGHSNCSIDAKSRLILPAKFRKYIKPEADNKLILTRGMDECLLVYPLDEWEKVKTGLTRYNQFNSDQRFFIRQFLNFVNECELDSQNRIVIPPQLLQFAKLKKEVIVLGLLDKMEIWNPEIKNAYDSSMTKSYEEIAEKVSEIINSQ